MVGFMIGVDSGKESIMHATTVLEPGDKYMHFPLDIHCGYDMEFFRGLISEKPVIHVRGGRATVYWEKFYARNEPLDCRVYARAAINLVGIDVDKLADSGKSYTRNPAKKQPIRRGFVVNQGVKL